MNQPGSHAYFTSALLHGGVILLIAFLAYASSSSRPDSAKIMELVAGPGDNYMGTEATKLGSETGVEIKVSLPAIAPAPPAPAPEPAPAQTAPAPPAEAAPIVPVTPAPSAAKPATKAVKLPANPMEKALVKSEIKTESKFKMREAAEKKKQAKIAAELARQKAKESYAEFMKSQYGSAAAPKGRAGGVAAGTTTQDGAGGKALTAQQIDEIAAWKALLRQRWIDGFVPPPDFDQKMTAQVSFHVSANGAISSIHVTSSTGGGGAAFESAVQDALRHVTMPVYPTHKGEDFSVAFSLRDEG